MPNRFAPRSLEDLTTRVARLRHDAELLEQAHLDLVEAAHPARRASTRNLLHYLALRQSDLRELQRELVPLGLSSLGRLEPNVMASVEAVQAALLRLAGREIPAESRAGLPCDFESGPAILGEQTRTLLGRALPGRHTRIMVTMPTEAASDYSLVRDLVRGGMSVMRINCAHDGPEVWRQMAGHLQRANAECRGEAKVEMDLAGPKIRVGDLGRSVAVARVSPRRDLCGEVAAPCRLWIGAGPIPATDGTSGRSLPGIDASIPLQTGLIESIQVGDLVEIEDRRGGRRCAQVVRTARGGLVAELRHTVYYAAGGEIRLRRGGKILDTQRIGAIPMVENPLLLKERDRLILRPSDWPARREERDSSGEVVVPAEVPVGPIEIFTAVEPGQRIFFDDGKIAGRIEAVTIDRIEVAITRAKPGGANLRSDRGINLPDSGLGIDALTPQDLENLDLAVEIADLVGLSFVHDPEDLLRLREALVRRDALDRCGVLIKIETMAAFDGLAGLLIAAMQFPRAGVMVARGDLAVEIGFARLAEVQEEVLWLCEAAHIPTVWATQVLEGLAKKGRPSRAEVTDAAMSGRAECVMLNKGPFLREAVAFLDDVLRRMQLHQSKKRPLLRRLRVSDLALPPQGGQKSGGALRFFDSGRA
ncbi:MAG: pyruvate kinase [Candidatus Eisenbacteria bacterium]|nr:pyruvate kinase [Candidatus Eisenbacteria bacterium]